jgi:hypothetical protein
VLGVQQQLGGAVPAAAHAEVHGARQRVRRRQRRSAQQRMRRGWGGCRRTAARAEQGPAKAAAREAGRLPPNASNQQ